LCISFATATKKGQQTPQLIQAKKAHYAMVAKERDAYLKKRTVEAQNGTIYACD